MPSDYLEAVREKNEQRLMSLPGVASVSTSDFGEPGAIVISVKANTAADVVKRLPNNVDHVPVKVITLS